MDIDPHARPEGRGGLASVTGRVAAELLTESHLLPPAEIGGALERAGRPLGVLAARIYLADLQQRRLTLVAADGEEREADALAIDTSPAGQAYQTVTIQLPAPPEHGRDAPAGEARRVWIPLVDGTERLGVLGLIVADLSEELIASYRTLASLIGLMIVAKRSYSDTYAQAQRTREMALQGEVVWALLPPRTFATSQVLVTATIEPAYKAGGDAFDYSVLGDHLHLSVFDALGHDLSAGLLASVGIGSCRSTRRAGGSLADVADLADRAISGFFSDQAFVTALLSDLNVATGLFTWIPCGHPPPLLIRGGREVTELYRRARPPLGLGRDYRGRGGPGDREVAASPYVQQLEPGDRVLIYTDGVTEGRAPDGTLFGVQRLADFVIGHGGSLPAPEMMRRLNHAILDYQQGELRDDATAVLIEWQPASPGPSLTP